MNVATPVAADGRGRPLGRRLARRLAAHARAAAAVEARTLHALAALLALVLLPHLPHLPVWVIAAAGATVVARLVALHHPRRALALALSPPVLAVWAIALAVLIRLDYGYLVGRDPCVAFLVVLVAAKFAELRRGGDATLVICLAAFLLLTQFFYSQSILATLATLPAVLALGNALAVLRDPERAAPTATRLRLVATLLVQGLPLAALLFFLFPRLPGPLWSLPEDASATTGLSDSMAPGEIGSLSRSSAVAFRVEFDGAVPPPTARYWRGPVLERFDGRRWTGSPMPPVMPPSALDDAAPAGRGIAYSVMLQPHRQRWLFAIEAPLSLPRAGADGAPLASLHADGQLLADEPVTELLRYRQRSLPGATLVTGETPSPTTRALPGRNPRSIALGRRLRAEAEGDRALAESLLARFRDEPYRYTLDPPPLPGEAPIDDFLFGTRAGFCEHYAAAFVVVMRAAGIPARVVTGYLGGEMNGDYMIVRQSDAHAWAEAWIDGAWRRFDPTGAVAPSRVETGLAAALPDSAAVPRMARADGSWIRAARLRWDALNHHWQRLVVGFDDESQRGLWQRLGFAEPALWQLATVLLAAAALWSFVVLWRPRLPRRARDARPWPERAWTRLEILLARRGIARRPDESPAEYIGRASAALPEGGERLARLGATLVAARFAPSGDGHRARHEAVEGELRALERSARRDARFGTRWRNAEARAPAPAAGAARGRSHPS